MSFIYTENQMEDLKVMFDISKKISEDPQLHKLRSVFNGAEVKIKGVGFDEEAWCKVKNVFMFGNYSLCLKTDKGVEVTIDQEDFLNRVFEVLEVKQPLQWM